MTDCQTTRDWILEVDPEELEQVRPEELGQDDTSQQQHATGEHASHLTGCPECRALAYEILEAEAALRVSLDSVEPALDVEAALAQAREAYEVEETHQATSRRRRWQVALPMAAAALGGLLLIGRPWLVPAPSPTRAFDPATITAARALGLIGPRPVVRAGSDERVAVLPTENPNITVIWFME